MKIKYTFSLLFLILFTLASAAQNFRDINLHVSSDKNDIRYIEFYTGNLVFAVSQKGTVKLNTLRNTQRKHEDAFTNSGKLTSLDNMAIDYYDNFNANYAGKLKSVGNIVITYNDQFDGLDNRGRVKTIGNIKFAYADRFDGLDNRGKIKSIGDIRVTYYDRFDGTDLNGKLKSIGNTTIQYYDRFDGADKSGKIKSITGKTPHVTISNLTDDEDSF
jgi:hypothetical protein